VRIKKEFATSASEMRLAYALRLAINAKFLHQLGGAFLGGRHPLRTEEEMDNLFVPCLPGWTGNFHQLFD